MTASPRHVQNPWNRKGKTAPGPEYLMHMLGSLLTLLSGGFPQYDGDVVAISLLSEEDLEMRELCVPEMSMKMDKMY